MTQRYNDPAGGTQSSVGKQINTAFWLRKSIVEARQEQLFSPLADVTNMPRHYGKQIKVYHYFPILDDRNINDQGIDANGATITNGNLYGSSRDIGTILGAIPVLGEEGGKVNRVGTTRAEIVGSINRLGIYRSFTNESMVHDTDPELYVRQQDELIKAAYQLNEDYLQIELIQASETILYCGAATKLDEVTGEGSIVSELNYNILGRADTVLNNLRCPKTTRIIKGSAFSGTVPIPACRILFVNSDLEQTLRNMRDNFNEKAFIPVEQYAYENTLLNKEIGKIGNFRIVSDSSVVKRAGVGAECTDTNTNYRTTEVGGKTKYDVYPAIIVGQDSFTQIGFDAPNNTNKFTIKVKMPNTTGATNDDPYDENGIASIKWYYGVLPYRAERIVVINTVCRN